MYTLVKTMQRVIKKTSCFLFVFMLTSTLLYTSYVCAKGPEKKEPGDSDLTNTNTDTITGDPALKIIGPGTYTIINNGTITGNNTGNNRSIYFEFTPSCGATFNFENKGLISGNIEVEKTNTDYFYHFNINLTGLNCGALGDLSTATITNTTTGVIRGDTLDLGTFISTGGFEGVTFDNKGVITGNTITLMGGTVKNSGTITATQCFTGFYYYPQTSGSPTLQHYLTNETGGSIIANGTLTLETTCTLKNQTGATITVAGTATFGTNVIVENQGYIKINNGNFSGNITNSGTGTITIDNIKNVGSSRGNFTNNASSTIAITNSFNQNNLKIENQGSVLLPAHSQIASYEGKGSSELVLTLPRNQTSSVSALLAVEYTASFSQKSKIILAGTPTAQGQAYPVNIITASTITMHGSVTDLLYSQVRNNNAAPTLTAGSIFINIATATLKTNNNQSNLRYIIAATVEFINPLNASTSLTAANKKVVKSLLGYDILQETNISNASQPPTTNVAAGGSAKPPGSQSSSSQSSSSQSSSPQSSSPQSSSSQSSSSTPLTAKPSVSKTSGNQHKKIIPKHLQHIDTSGVEYSQVVNNHLDISSSLIDSISTITPDNQQSFNFRNLNYNILGAVGYYSGSDNHEKFKHSWKQTMLHIGGESALDKTKFGLSFAYLGCDMSVPNKPNSKSNSYLALVHAKTNISPWSFSTGLIFGTTKYNDPSTKNKSIGEVSAIASSRYEFTVNKFKVNLGLNSALTHVSMSEYKNKNISIDSNKKLFLCLGASAGAARSYNIQNNINLTTEINGGYSYTQGIQNEDHIIVPSSGSYKLPQNDIAKHNLKINIKNYCYYKKIYYSLSFNCNYNSSSTLFGGNFAMSYKF